jgi:hypothetical protein
MYAGSNTWRPQVPVSVIFELIQPQIEQAPVTEKQKVLPVFSANWCWTYLHNGSETFISVLGFKMFAVTTIFSNSHGD